MKTYAAPYEDAVGVVVVPGLEDDEPCTGEEDEQEELILDREAELFARLRLRWDITNKRGPAYGY